MKIRKLEIIAISVFISDLFIIRLENELSETWLRLSMALLFLGYLVGSYSIFKPSDKIKWGRQISMINGITLSTCNFFILETIYVATIYIPFVGMAFLILLFITLILVLMLYFKNKKFPENKPYLKSVGIRNVIPFGLFLVLIALPDKARIITFYGSDSKKNYQYLQNELIGRAYAENDAGNNVEAINTSLSSLNYSKLRNDTLSGLYHASLNVLGYSYLMNNNYSDADSVLHKALQVVNNDSGGYYKTIYYLGLNYSGWGYYTKSDSFLKISLRDSIRHEYVLKKMAFNSNQKGKFLRADSLYKLSLLKYKESGLKDFSSYLSTLSDVGKNYVDMIKFTSADSIYNEALEIANENYGKSSDQAADVYSNLSDLYCVLGQYEKAKEYAIKNLDIITKVYGKDNTAYLYSLVSLTSINMALSDYDKAESTLLDVLSIIENNDTKSPLAALVYDNLTMLYKDFSNFYKANDFSKRSLATRNYLYGKSSLKTATSLDHRAYICYCSGDYNIADSLYNRTLKIKRYYQGRINQNYATSVNGLALVYIAVNRLERADTLLDFAKSILEEVVGEEHPDYATMENNKGYLKLKEKKLDEAKACFQKAISINRKSFGDYHLNIADNLIGLASVNTQQHLYAEARVNYTEALSILKKLFKFVHPKRATIEKELEALSKK